MQRTVLRSALSLVLTTVAVPFGVGAATTLFPKLVHADDGASIKGSVTDKASGDSIEGAIVILQCNCLQGSRERRTSGRGVYSFTNLPQGVYTIQVLFGEANISKEVRLPRDSAFKANFAIDPGDPTVRDVTVKTPPIKIDPRIGTTVDMGPTSDIPVASSANDNGFDAVIDLAPTAGADAGGRTIGGGTSAEAKYSVDGANLNDPSFGTLGAAIIRDFIDEVEILEGGYEAEFGDVATGQINVRRISGTNVVRGSAGVRFAPRFAEPRFITGTDAALRVTQVGDYQASAWAQVSGPIIEDKLFFSVGFSGSGTQNTLVQSFYSRVDKDNSGGYEDCPFENGANDCVDGQNFIATDRFAEQRFRAGAVGLGWQAVLSWTINPKHSLRLSAGGGNFFTRTSYRLPVGIDPTSFGTNPTADPLGGASRIANGVINDHFGWDQGNQTTVGLNYAGRVQNDKLEIDATVAYSQFDSRRAWRLDNEAQREIPVTQEQDAQGRNLYEFLDREQALNLVPGVEDACNNAGLPGLACPTRVWLSGGIGQYGSSVARRTEARLALTHFFNAAGAHQLKYGAQFEWLQRNVVEQYSGANLSDFQSNCPAGQVGGGEYCYDPANNAYSFNNSVRVNNNRAVVVDSDNPENRFTFGYGTVRREQGDLRALATPLGNGVRVPQYNASLSTYNYAAFLQDRWAILSNLYLTAGVRWQIQDMHDILGRSQILIWDNVAPRVGVVYDWTDEGKSRLFASYGWFYQNLPVQLASRVFGGLVSVQGQYRNSDCEGVTTAFDRDGDGVPEAYSRTDNGAPTEWCVDQRTGTTGLTVGSIVPRLRGQYNQQLVLGYEQEIIEDLVLGFRWLHTDLGRAVEDVSTNGGLNFLIANPGVEVSESDIAAKRAECDGLREEFETLEAADPDGEANNAVARELQQCSFLVDAFEKVNTQFDKPTRNFDAWTFEARKRFAKNWLFSASYTYSRQVGNYDGFVDPTTGAINIGQSTQYDIPELVRNSFGPLSFNVPHRVKLDGAYTFDLKGAGRLALGGSFRFQSGYPINVRGDNNRYAGQYLVYVLPRGAGGQIEPNYQVNLQLSYAYPLPKDLELHFNFRLVNITNAKSVLRVDDVYSFQVTRPVAGGSLSDLKHTKVQNATDPGEFFNRGIVTPQGNYGVETQFQQPISGQLELSLRF